VYFFVRYLRDDYNFTSLKLDSGHNYFLRSKTKSIHPAGVDGFSEQLTTTQRSSMSTSSDETATTSDPSKTEQYQLN